MGFVLSSVVLKCALIVSMLGLNTRIEAVRLPGRKSPGEKVSIFLETMFNEGFNVKNGNDHTNADWTIKAESLDGPDAVKFILEKNKTSFIKSHFLRQKNVKFIDAMQAKIELLDENTMSSTPTGHDVRMRYLSISSPKDVMTVGIKMGTDNANAVLEALRIIANPKGNVNTIDSEANKINYYCALARARKGKNMITRNQNVSCDIGGLSMLAC